MTKFPGAAIIYITKDNDTRETSRYTTSAAYIHANLAQIQK